MFVQVRFYRREYALSNNKIKVLAGQNDRTIKSDGKINSSLHKEKVLEYLQQYDSITTVLAMQLLSLGKSRTAEILALMVANGVIIKKRGWASNLLLPGYIKLYIRRENKVLPFIV